ncbi:hypothetical protein I7I50_04636 [Histoplasma capsulatum G186AR]|uniref:Secreted protein n=1 Tax=Ajellomyces capsulatus TaxID=5037 RepID=A0A8H7YMR0_AJECA|nr:hypothetical protein I7I52_05545 [Histoplasma capsulatum]QSS75488.1 hypothetical protein I7I50_04636 [Histoplasma capsulatum G186AR]
MARLTQVFRFCCVFLQFPLQFSSPFVQTLRTRCMATLSTFPPTANILLTSAAVESQTLANCFLNISFLGLAFSPYFVQ